MGLNHEVGRWATKHKHSAGQPSGIGHDGGGGALGWESDRQEGHAPDFLDIAECCCDSVLQPPPRPSLCETDLSELNHKYQPAKPTPPL